MFLLLLLFPLSFISLVVAFFKRNNRELGTFAFFHPYCDAGGGGERVLWQAISAMDKRFSDILPHLKFVIYTGDLDRTPEQILEKAHSRFGLSVRKEGLQFVYLRWRSLLEARNYPRFTLIGQMLAGLVVGAEALWRLTPQWFIDTTGCPFTLPLFRIAGAKTLCYVHYPTITKEMIRLVDSRTASYNNSATIASSALLSRCKVLYYRAISLLYRACGRCAHLTMVNGSWTAAHIAELWGCQVYIVFPPCDVQQLVQLKNESEQLLRDQPSGPVTILSVGQIRPEKNHEMQLDVLAEVIKRLKARGSELQVKLVVAGGCRNEEDQNRVELLKRRAVQQLGLKLGKDIDFALNVPFERLVQLLQNAMIGLHTMWNEHFGISVVEGLAAGLVMVAHDSGGPKLDIVVGPSPDSNLPASEKSSGKYEGCCGFLADTVDGYAEAILGILLSMTSVQRGRLRAAARQRAHRFSDQQFDRTFCDYVAPWLTD